MPQAERALAILQEWIQSESLRKHSYAVADSMKHFAQLRDEDVDLAAVKKKMKDKAFARAVNREEIVRGAEQLAMPLDEVITHVIAALKADANRLGLAGRAS